MAIFVITMRGYFVVAPSSSKSTLFVLNPILIVGVLYGKIYDGRKLRFFFANTRMCVLTYFQKYMGKCNFVAFRALTYRSTKKAYPISTRY